MHWEVVLRSLGPDDPSKIGKFQLIGKLGEGGMGQAYLATHGSKHYVVKIILASLANDATYASRFQREIEATQRIQGPNVVRIIEHGVWRRRPWYASEYEDGCDLAQLVQAAPLDERAARILLAFLAKGLAAIHRAGVVHRDVKPGNVIVNKQGTPKFIDLGIAHDAQADLALTQVGTRIGTPGYMPLEQMAGEQPQPAWDVFALGCLAVFAVTGRKAFADSHAVALRRPDLSGVPQGLLPVIRRCLDPDPRRRPKAAELIALFEEHVAPTNTSWLPTAARTQVEMHRPFDPAVLRYTPVNKQAAPPPAVQLAPTVVAGDSVSTRPMKPTRPAPRQPTSPRVQTNTPKPTKPSRPSSSQPQPGKSNGLIPGLVVLALLVGIGVIAYAARGYIPLPYSMLPGETITGPAATFTARGDKKTYLNDGTNETYTIESASASGYDLAVQVSWNQIWHEDIEEACLVFSNDGITGSSHPSSTEATKTAEGGPGTVTLHYEGALLMTGDLYLALRCDKQTIHPIGKNAIKGGGTLSLAKRAEDLYRETFIPVQVRRQSDLTTVVSPRRATGWTAPDDDRFCIKSGKAIIRPTSDEPAKGNHLAWRLTTFSLAQNKEGTLYSGCDSAGNGIGRGVKLPKN